MNSRKELQRIEAFSDAVFAIACTLLVLEFKVPHVESGAAPGALSTALLAAWPSYLAYILSFGSILIAWAGHHGASGYMVGTSKTFVYANGFLLLTVTFIPYPTAVVAEYVNTPQGNVAVMFYLAAYLLLSVGFNIWWLSMFWPVQLMPSASKAFVKRMTIHIFSGWVLCAAAIVISYWLPIVGLVFIFLDEIRWILVSGGRVEEVT